MTFRKGARLNPGQLRDLRGRGGGMRGFGLPGGLGGGFGRGGGGRGGGMGLPLGGGVVGLIVVVVLFLVMSGALDGLLGSAPGPGPGAGAVEDARGGDTLQRECVTGEDANRRDDCAIVGFVNSIQAYWTDAFADSGRTYQEAQTTLFDAPTQTGCAR